ncbi:hypothetical protein SLEP1_g40446 [Rubroshorea leprosula]|uniref:Uncharacterized protein n=1 Tax=Rubroshorea leprosula TaxID=152421 RepID=A0AAV5L498_9ROSI|nr:hypothetical protein SLEP1_g40446 [Rubroshorea leprosula]
MDRIGEERRGTDDRWNDGKEDLVSNRAGFNETVQLCAQRKELRRKGGSRCTWLSSGGVLCPQSADIKSAALCCVVAATVAF